MTQYNTLNVKLSNSQPIELKWGMENGAKGILNLSSNLICDSSDETNVPGKLLSTDKQVWRPCKALVNNSSANIKISETQLAKTVQFVGSLLEIMMNSKVFTDKIDKKSDGK